LTKMIDWTKHLCPWPALDHLQRWDPKEIRKELPPKYKSHIHSIQVHRRRIFWR
jgi:hypothetical protein